MEDKPVYLSYEGGLLTLWDGPGEGRVKAIVSRNEDGYVTIASTQAVPKN